MIWGYIDKSELKGTWGVSVICHFFEHCNFKLTHILFVVTSKTLRKPHPKTAIQVILALSIFISTIFVYHTFKNPWCMLQTPHKTHQSNSSSSRIKVLVPSWRITPNILFFFLQILQPEYSITSLNAHLLLTDYC